MQKQLLDLRMDKNSGSNNASGPPTQLKKYEYLVDLSKLYVHQLYINQFPLHFFQ